MKRARKARLIFEKGKSPIPFGKPRGIKKGKKKKPKMLRRSEEWWKVGYDRARS